MKQKMTGAKIVIEALKKEGVSVVFAYPGGSIIPVFDALYGDKDIRFVLPRHEQAGGHEADGYARATGKPGVVITTGGPGATNLTTALATAHMDSIPLVAITGQVKTHLIGTDAFQEADMTGVSYPITKHNYLIKDIRTLAQTIKEAFHIATTGRPGPVLIALPLDIQNDETVFDYEKKVEMRSYNPTRKGHPQQIKKVAELIARAERPIILVGGGVIASGATEEAREFVEKTNMPVTSTLMGLGSIPSLHQNFLGMLGMHGTAAANFAMAEADLILNIGARFDDRVTGKTESFARKATVIHIDIDPSSIGKNIPTHLPIVGDAKEVLVELIKEVKKTTVPKWHEKIITWKKEHPIHYASAKNGVSPSEVFATLNRYAKDHPTIYTTEVGQHQMWAAQLLELTYPRQLITSGGLGTMGFGFPAAIGASIAFPEKTVVCCAGDGSFQMNEQELALLANYRIPVKIIIFNNGFLGMVRQWQEMFHDKRYSGTCLSRETDCPLECDGKECREYFPNFVKLADAYGIPGFRVTHSEEMDTVLTKALLEKGPALIEVVIPREENVMPMVPPGKANEDLIENVTVKK